MVHQVNFYKLAQLSANRMTSLHPHRQKFYSTLY